MDLLEKGTYCAGTIRTNRKDFPKEILPAGSTKMSIGSFRFASTSKLTAVWWLDRRDVYAMSNMHNTSVTVVMKRPKGCKNKVPIHILSVNNSRLQCEYGRSGLNRSTSELLLNH